MKCKYCGKKGVSLSHFPKKHGKILRARAAKVRRSRKAAPVERSSKRRGVAASVNYGALAAAGFPLTAPWVVPQFQQNFCPTCGKAR